MWPEMIERARHTVDINEYYATSQPQSRLEPVIDALARAVKRGVVVRMIVDAGFAQREPATVARLEKIVRVHRYDWAARGGGVLHAKYFVVDGEELYLGSQNFDWRSLTHIQELGVRARSRELASMLEDVFESDWSRERVHRASTETVSLDGASVRFVASPRGSLPDEQSWDLPQLVQLIDGAKQRVQVQLLTYRARGLDELESALRHAAARNVEVDLLVSDWCKVADCIDGLQRMTGQPHMHVKLLSLPEASTGFIPYARVAHAKYLVVDGVRAWIGTSNWERDYFYASRNVGLVIDGGTLPRRLERFFDDDWKSAYAAPVDASAHYSPPRIH